jgi:hypothetical protein
MIGYVATYIYFTKDMEANRSLETLVHLVRDSIEFKTMQFVIFRIFENGKIERVSDKAIDNCIYSKKPSGYLPDDPRERIARAADERRLRAKDSAAPDLED